MRTTSLWIVALLAGCALAGCAHAPRPALEGEAEEEVAAPPAGPPAGSTRRRPSIFVAPQAPPSFSAEARARIARHCLHGLPRGSSGPPLGSTDWVVRDGYVLQHSAFDKIALFVCERVDAKNLDGTAARRDPFAPDPLLAKGRRAELSDYKRSGFSRGHQAPAANQRASQARNDETFFLSNMTPQLQALNGGIWERLEERVRDWAARFGTVWVLTGPMFYDPQEEDRMTADGAVEYRVIGAGEVSVPTHYFKIVVREEGGALKAAAFAFEHRKHPSGVDLAKHLVSIDWVEARTGLDFMPDLSPEQERGLERSPGELWP
ncbi:MAG: DNA/RNA non-specific endonuclease [Deltaproteobacteria bacterium]|nr:DNA/RNA non-specific endonuclease [Deltaproteobacteria bacterium]